MTQTEAERILLSRAVEYTNALQQSSDEDTIQERIISLLSAAVEYVHGYEGSALHRRRDDWTYNR